MGANAEGAQITSGTSLLLRKERPRKLTIATLNVCGWTESKQLQTIAACKTRRVHVCVLTETRRKVTTLTDEWSTTGAAESIIRSRTATGVALAHRRSMHVEWLEKLPRYAVVELMGDVVLIGAYGPNEMVAIHQRMDFYATLTDKILEHQEKGKTVVVVGDLNAGHQPVQSSELKHTIPNYTMLMQMLQKTGLSITSTEPTWRSKGKVYRTLDYCLIPKNVEARIELNWNLAVADHAFLLAEITLDQDRDKGRPRGHDKVSLPEGDAGIVALISRLGAPPATPRKPWMTWGKLKNLEADKLPSKSAERARLRELRDRTVTGPPSDIAQAYWRWNGHSNRKPLVIVDEHENPLCNAAAAGKVADVLGRLWGAARPHSFRPLVDNAPPIAFTEAELHQAVRALKKGAAPGPDKVTPGALKDATPQILAELLRLANLAYTSAKAGDLAGAIPQRLKLTRVTPIPKAKEFAKANEIRPIATQSVLLKVWNKMILNRIDGALEASMHKDQHAYRKGRSTVTAIKALLGVLSTHPRVYIAFLDYSKAFDSITFHALEQTIDCLGIDPALANLIKAEYSGASISVRVKTSTAPAIQHTRGIRQGCSLSAGLFASAIAGTHRWVDCTVGEKGRWAFSYSDDKIEVATSLDTLMKAISENAKAAKTLGLALNESKCAILCSERSTVGAVKLPPEINGIRTTSEAKWLGVKFTSDRKWAVEVEGRIAAARTDARALKLRLKQFEDEARVAAKPPVHRLIATRVTVASKLQYALEALPLERGQQEALWAAIAAAYLEVGRIPVVGSDPTSVIETAERMIGGKSRVITEEKFFSKTSRERAIVQEELKKRMREAVSGVDACTAGLVLGAAPGSGQAADDKGQSVEGQNGSVSMRPHPAAPECPRPEVPSIEEFMARKLEITKLKESRLTCRVCGKPFSSAKGLNKHIKENHQGEPQVPELRIQCADCKVGFRPLHYPGHRCVSLAAVPMATGPTQEDSKPESTCEAGDTGSMAEERRRAMRTQEADEQMRRYKERKQICPQCGMKSKSLIETQKHMISEHKIVLSSEPLRIWCALCKRNYCRKEYYIKHKCSTDQ